MGNDERAKLDALTARLEAVRRTTDECTERMARTMIPVAAAPAIQAMDVAMAKSRSAMAQFAAESNAITHLIVRLNAFYKDGLGQVGASHAAISKNLKGFRDHLNALGAKPTREDIIAVARVDLGISEEELRTMTVRKLDSFLKRLVRRQAPVIATEKVSPPHKQPKRFEGLANKPRVDLSRYMEQGRLTPRQHDCYSLVKEFGLDYSDTARRLDLHRSTVTEHVKAAERRIVLAAQNDKYAKRRAVHQQD